MKQELQIVKIGGKVMDNDRMLDSLLGDFASLKGYKVLVHGGGGQATRLAERLKVKTSMIDGRRITDRNSLEIAVMVYAGLLNKKLVAKLQSLKINALGMSGADLNLIKASRRVHPDIDFGEVGDIESNGINYEVIVKLVNDGITPVICAITHDGNGNLFNTNADTIASMVAVVLADHFDVHLTFCFEHNGVLKDARDPGSFITDLGARDYATMKKSGVITGGMIPKLDNAFSVLRSNVSTVKIKNAMNLSQTEGTNLILDE